MSRHARSPLGQAYRVQEDVARVGFDWPDARGPLDKVMEEIAELEREVRDGGWEMRDALVDELGDLLFAVVNLSRKLGIAKFTRRFERVKRLAQERGLQMGRASLAQLDKLWNEVKRTEKDGGGRRRSAKR